MRKYVLLSLILVFTICLCKVSVWAESVRVSEEQSSETVNDKEIPKMDAVNKDDELDRTDMVLETTLVKDPIQPYNRAIFTFNDKLYFHAIRPAYKGYNVAVPEKARSGVRNFFSNIKTPVRFFNCIFQGKFKGAGTELLRLTINSTGGLAGFLDPAKKYFHLEKQEEDFGQTLGKYGMGHGSFIEWPFFGPSNMRDTLGFVGDVALNPLTVVSFVVNPFITTGSGIYNELNEVSLDKGEAYESIVKPAIDPYIAVQDAYTQNRAKKIKE
ncbi:MAG: VacJ family lipoprotein [Candidatus Scalinduaceae bacterium]